MLGFLLWVGLIIGLLVASYVTLFVWQVLITALWRDEQNGQD
jgi:hypothetical protein